MIIIANTNSEHELSEYLLGYGWAVGSDGRWHNRKKEIKGLGLIQAAQLQAAWTYNHES